MPWDIVRLPCGSMSTHSTRWPSSAKAAARFSVVVVLATPPFWLANAMTLALPCTGGSDARLLESRRREYSQADWRFLHDYDPAMPIDPVEPPGRPPAKRASAARTGARAPTRAAGPLRDTSARTSSRRPL